MTVFSDSPQMAVRLMKCDADCAESKLATCMKRVQVDGAMFGRVGNLEWVMPSASELPVSEVEEKSVNSLRSLPAFSNF